MTIETFMFIGVQTYIPFIFVDHCQFYYIHLLVILESLPGHFNLLCHFTLLLD